MDMINGIAAASVSMSAMQLETATSTALLKKSMEGMEQQALSLIEDMTQSVPVSLPRQGYIDTYI